MNIIIEMLTDFLSGVYVGLVAVWNALGIQETLDNTVHQVVATGLGVPLLVVSIIFATPAAIKICCKVYSWVSDFF